MTLRRSIGPNAEIVEFGAGSSRKIRLLLDALHRPQRFVPIDISGEHLHASADALREAYPALEIRPVVADFTRPVALPPRMPGHGARVGFFPGSSIGNFDPHEARRFLRQLANQLRGGGLLIGIDLVKDPAILHAAYNDAAGVTAAFNRNLLVRANRELGADFEVNDFAHYAFYNAPLQRIEMHLGSVAAKQQGTSATRLLTSLKAIRYIRRTRTNSRSRASARWPSKRAFARAQAGAMRSAGSVCTGSKHPT